MLVSSLCMEYKGYMYKVVVRSLLIMTQNGKRGTKPRELHPATLRKHVIRNNE